MNPVHEGGGRAATIISRTRVVFIEENLLSTLLDRIFDAETSPPQQKLDI